MTPQVRQYLFGLIFIGFGIFQLTQHDRLEASLYLTAGAAFIVNTLAGEPRLDAYKKILVILTWALIIAAGLLFFYLLQFRYF